MSTYTLNGTDLSTFGFTAGRQSGSNIGLSGFLDMPDRLGKTYHSWGDNKSVEPYVSASDIRFGGRDLQLVGYIRGDSRLDVLAKCQALRDFIDDLTGLVPLACEWGTYQIRVGAIPIQSMHATTASVTINMREPVVNLSGALPIVDNGEYGIDSISWDGLGVELVGFTGDRLSRPETKTQQFTAWENEGYQITKTGPSILDLTFLVQSVDYSSLLGTIQGLYALFSQSGTRMLSVKNDTYREVFVVDGFRVENIRSGSQFTCMVAIKAIQVTDDWYFLTDNAGNFITDNNYNKILIH